MPTYAPVSATVVSTPALLATLNELANKTLIPQGYIQSPFCGALFGINQDLGLAGIPKVKIPNFKKPTRMTGSGTQHERIVNFESTGNMRAFYAGTEFTNTMPQGGTKLFVQPAHYRTYNAQFRTDRVENSGSGKQYDLFKASSEQVIREAFYKLETDLLSTNTDTNHNTSQFELPGIRHLNSTSPSTGTRAGIDTSVYTPFANNTATVASFATGGLDAMESMHYTTAGKNGDSPVSVIFTTEAIHRYYSKQAMAIHRLVGSLNGVDLGTTGVLSFKGTPIIHTNRWPSGRMDFLETANIDAVVWEGCDWVMERLPKRNNVAMAEEVQWFFTPALMFYRPEANGVLSVTAE